MIFGPDALKIGPLALEWGRLGLIAGSILFLMLAGRAGRRVEGAAFLVLLAAVLGGRLAYVIADPINFSTAPNGWLSLLDPRYGSLSLPFGAASGLAAALIVLRGRAATLAGPAALSVLVGLGLPLLRPAPSRAVVPPETPVFSMTGAQLQWGSLPRPSLVNFWATWCPPCREEMPLLAEYARRGAAIVFMDDGENPAVIERYLRETGLAIEVVISSRELDDALSIAALPTTVAVDSSGRIIARHLGPLDRRGLEDLLRFIEGK